MNGLRLSSTILGLSIDHSKLWKTYVGTSGGGRPVPTPGREGGAGGALPVASPGRLGTAGAGRPAAGGAGGARLTDEAGPGAGADGTPLIGRRLGPPGEGGDTRWPILENKGRN